MSQVVLVTGACGFFGRHMCEYLSSLEENLRVVGTDIRCEKALRCDDFYELDLLDEEGVRGLLQSLRPDYIIHLAGVFTPREGTGVYAVNVLSVLSLLEGTRRFASEAAVVVAGSAAEYGRVGFRQLPIDEQEPCLPLTLYGLSKCHATALVQFYHRVHGISGMVIRLFQLIGKGMSEDLAPGAFYQQLQSATSKSRTTVKVGNLHAIRDFLDVRDAVEAVWSLCKKPKWGEVFNVCSGRPTRLLELLDAMIDCSASDVVLEKDPRRIRPDADPDVIYGTYEKIKRQCGWEPRRAIEASVLAIFNSINTTGFD